LKFNPGDLAFVKTTNEKVVVLAIGPKTVTVYGNVTHELLEGELQVRRPLATKDNGLQYTKEFFYEFELEHFDEQLAREFSDMEKVEALRAKLQAGAKAAGQNQTFPLVN
jgi:hypothetical protein